VPGELDAARLAWLRGYYGRGVLAHFEYEERHLFPALLEVCETPLLCERLRELAREHGVLRQLLSRLLDELEALTEPGCGRAAEEAVVEGAQRTVERLLAHAAAEDALIQPLLERHGGIIRPVMAMRTEEVVEIEPGPLAGWAARPDRRSGGAVSG
jgi:hemerythrin-like domain-containing protein